MIFRRLRFREPVDDRSPEPNNNHTESHSYEEDRPAEPIPEIDLEIPSDSIGNELRDISNLKSNVSFLNELYFQLPVLLGGKLRGHRQAAAWINRRQETFQDSTPRAERTSQKNDGKCSFYLEFEPGGSI